MLAVEDVEAYFAKSTIFRTRVGAANEAAAKGHVYYCESEFAPGAEAGATLAPLRPFLVLAPDRLSYQAGSEGQTTILQASGGVVVVISDNPKESANNKESFRDYWDWVTATLDEIASMHRTDDHFRFEISLAIPPWRPAVTERASDDFWESVFMFSYAAGK